MTGYAFNLCKFHIYTIPYNHNIPKEGMEMTQNRIRIVDVADALGLSTATVSKVIHGKTEIVLPVDLIKRESTRKLSCQSL